MIHSAGSLILLRFYVGTQSMALRLQPGLGDDWLTYGAPKSWR